MTIIQSVTGDKINNFCSIQHFNLKKKKISALLCYNIITFITLENINFIFETQHFILQLKEKIKIAVS